VSNTTSQEVRLYGAKSFKNILQNVFFNEVISENFEIFNLWPLTVQVIQMLIHSEASLAVSLLIKFERLNKQNSNTEHVGILNTSAYSFNTLERTQQFVKHTAV
jgi:hypothetical protein